jgi:hypothetical protein
MNFGMLWAQRDKSAPIDKTIREGAEYYEKKYKMKPTEVYLHPEMITMGKLGDSLDGMDIVPDVYILKWSYLLGERST